MREWLAFQCGKIFLLFFNLCGRLDTDTAVGMLRAMYKEMEEIQTQRNYNEAMKERISTPGR